MTEKSSPFDAVETGPRPSEPHRVPERPEAPEGDHHPSVVALRKKFGDAIGRYEINSGDQHVVFIDREKNHDILSFLHADPDQKYDFLADVTGVDYGGGTQVQVVWQLWSNTHKRALRVKAEVPEDDMTVRSVEDIWKTAGWLEREVYDLFGVIFEGHPDLRRIMMPEDYKEGHPLRKDFPLRGRFSRARQTAEALNQQVEHYYPEKELAAGREPILMDAGGEQREVPPITPVPLPEQPDDVGASALVDDADASDEEE